MKGVYHMQEINYSGNLFLLPSNPNTEAAVVTTNGIIKRDGRLVMGKGIAGYSASHHAGIDIRLAEHVRKNGNTPADAGTYHDAERAAMGIAACVRVLSLPTKDHWKDPSILRHIVDGCRGLMALADDLRLSRVYLPMPGCTNGGLSYKDQVRKAISLVLDDRFVVAVPNLDALPVVKDKPMLTGYDRDAASYETLATASSIGGVGEQMLFRATIAAITKRPEPYDWYEIGMPGKATPSVSSSLVFDPSFRLCSRIRQGDS